MSRLQNTVRDEASCRRHGPRRDRTPVPPGPCSATQPAPEGGSHGIRTGASPSGHLGPEPDEPDPPPDKPTPPARAFSGQAETLHLEESDQ